MKVINAGLVLVVIVLGFFVNDNLRLGRIRQSIFCRNNTNINMDCIVTDVVDEAITGIDEVGEAVVSSYKAEVVYERLVTEVLNENASDCTAFFIYTGNCSEGDFGISLEEDTSSQIKTVNKRLNYSFLFTEQTSSFLYNPTVKNSVYIMYLPKFANLIRPKEDCVIYSLSGALLE